MNPTASWKAGGRVDQTLIQGSDEEATSCTVASNVFPSGSEVEARLCILRKSLAEAIPLTRHGQFARSGGEKVIVQLLEAVLASNSEDVDLYEGCFVLVSLLLD